MARTFEPLAKRVCKAAYDLADGKLSQWVAVSVVAKEINVANTELIEGSIVHAVRMGWLVVEGKPVQSVMLTALGEPIAAQKTWQRPRALIINNTVFGTDGKKKARRKVTGSEAAKRCS